MSFIFVCFFLFRLGFFLLSSSYFSSGCWCFVLWITEKDDDRYSDYDCESITCGKFLSEKQKKDEPIMKWNKMCVVAWKQLPQQQQPRRRRRHSTIKHCFRATISNALCISLSFFLLYLILLSACVCRNTAHKIHNRQQQRERENNKTKSIELNWANDRTKERMNNRNNNLIPRTWYKLTHTLCVHTYCKNM